MDNVKTLASDVDAQGITDFIRRLGRDCSPTQFLREFVQNGIEAIQRTKKDGTVIVDYNHSVFEETGLHKICFIDDGDGMTPEQMLSLLKNLSASGRQKNKHENYGVGAKISAFSRNHAGIVYDSWKDGVGHRVVIKYDEKEDIYGLEGHTTANGGASWIYKLPKEMKPAGIDQHGTCVTLWGMEETQDTMMPIANYKGSREAWIPYFLNERFFRLPPGITMKARNGYYKDGTTNYLGNVFGQKQVLDKNAEIHGDVLIDETRYYWWVMPKDKSGKGRELVKGHTALVVQDEIFDIVDAKSNRVANFGVLAAPSRVIIYVEPKAGTLQHNVARTHVVNADSTPVCWNKWYDDFSNNMPEKLKDFIAQELARTTSANNTDEIKEKLKAIKELYKVSRYVPKKNGKLRADPDSESVYKTAHERFGDNPHPKPPVPRPHPDLFGSALTRMLTKLVNKDEGVEVKESNPDPFPTVKPVHADAENRESLRDRAAEYIENQNVIFLNKDFQGYVDLINYFAGPDLFGDAPQVRTMIDGEVQKAFELVLTECVTGALSMKNRNNWSPDDFERSISQEALTTAVACRWWMVGNIKRALGSKIKNYKPEQEAAE